MQIKLKENQTVLTIEGDKYQTITGDSLQEGSSVASIAYYKYEDIIYLYFPSGHEYRTRNHSRLNYDYFQSFISYLDVKDIYDIEDTPKKEEYIVRGAGIKKLEKFFNNNKTEFELL